MTRADTITPAELLALPLTGTLAQDATDETTIGEYLVKLLATLWAEGDQFSGKRPLGNSGWDFDLLAVLIYHDVIDGEIDESGMADDIERDAEEQGRALIATAIRALGVTSTPGGPT